MKLSNKYRYTVLCEDAQMKSFIISFLKYTGISPHKIRVINYPDGDGCGEAFVKKRYPLEVEILKATNHIRTVLIICTDADNNSVQKKMSDLDRAVSDRITGWSRLSEPVIMWIPKRHIETWIHFLQGENVDEEMKFRHGGNPVSCKKEAGIFSSYCQNIKEPQDKVLASMMTSKNEYLRVCNLQEAGND